ncbi:magnesium transporter [Salinisphaera orenii YIM 95161]|uniref:Magnesium transporter n=2 Tax=Salinisphaera TaxID=180541 RepID=A0A423PHP5_9GAMM|nr:magnesium transporter [Salinisphaera halophila YIM 95161]
MSPPSEDIDGQTPADAARTLSGRSPEEIRALLAQMPHEEALAVAAQLSGAAKEQAAGATTQAVASDIDARIDELVVPAPAILESTQTAAEAVAFLVASESVAEITYIFVVDAGRLVGVVGMRDIVLAKPGQRLAEIMVAEPFAFKSGTDIDAAVRAALARHYPVYPVVDDEGRLLGSVRGWQLFERVVVEVTGQAGAQVGVSREEQVTTPILSAFRMRHPWLQVNLLTAFVAAFVVGMFEDTITQIVALAAFLPVLAGQSGNTGCQALAITLRGLTLGQLDEYPVGKLLRKETLLGALNGFVVGIVAGVAMWLYASMSGEANAVMLGVVILVAMLGACTGSGIFGVVVPLTLKRFGADPAMASSIFLTTFTDILGMGLMLFLASWVLL